ncbi:PD-(D/E)XK nuclease family protein [Halosimplex aquaticum]|uniref:PD-(D/E)XK nuclease family protein n=1 Tax=Halosimplex aquaticum TaxID=3026162 RepID=A0ABD5YAL5_9EURY|nr:PD-(D/E)XK nuclease family protein [Halosimplex aquaticum]
MPKDEQSDTSSTIKSSSSSDRKPATLRRKQLVDAISNDSFNDWYQEQQFTENILEGKPYFNGASPPPDSEKHSPSKLLQCHRKVRYYAENSPKEGDPPQGLFWVGSQFEEEIVVPYLLEAIATDETYVRNSMWIDTEIETNDGTVRLKGVTDPVIVDADGDPILVTEIKTTSSLDYLDGPKPHHKAQLHAYMYALDEEYDRSLQDGLLLYGGRDTLDISVFHIPFDERFWNKSVITWMQAQTQYRANNELPPREPAFDWECNTCPFRNRCGQTSAPFQDTGFTGLLTGFTDYREPNLREYFDAYPGAKLTPTLAHEYPVLAEQYGVYNWKCRGCGSTYAWDDVDVESDSPLCDRCAENNDLQTIVVLGPNEQNVDTP